jgi:putative SOS response-associated peptidase YedK
MCGRYTCRRYDLVKATFDAQPTFPEFDERPRFNIAPTQTVPIVRIDSKGNRVIGLAQWGLIPSWTKGKPKFRPINARAENIATSPMFRQAIERRRCLIPADGFYEWKGAKAPKQPFFIHLKDDGLFALGGLWERWRPEPDAEPIDTFTIITVQPNAVTSPIHNRMPLIIAPADYGRWLDPTTPRPRVAALLRPYPADGMDALPVSAEVNNTRNDGPQLIKPANGVHNSAG